MKNLTNYILEKLVINKNTKVKVYNYHPKDEIELRKILENRLAQDKNADLNDIDISQITDMGELYGDTGLFEDLDPHNINISDWNVNHVTNMESMFYNCENFDCDLSNWDVSNVEDMSYMFYNCSKFTGKGLNNWKVKIDNINKVKQIFAFAHIHELPEWWIKIA